MDMNRFANPNEPQRGLQDRNHISNLKYLHESKYQLIAFLIR